MSLNIKSGQINIYVWYAKYFWSN